jgi:PTH1 family peptidyl-tRNA hydrolase
MGQVAGPDQPMENQYLVVGLGNPGSEYARTRHNAGFLVVARMAEGLRADWGYEKKFNARLARAESAGRKIVLCEPLTYMNSSGEAVGAVVGFYRIALPRLLIVVDDADLPLGEIRLRPGGSSGGHHGLESVERHLGTPNYARLRVGIGRERGAREITDYVLGRFSSTESALLDKVLNAATGQVACWLDAGLQKAMSQFNGVVTDSA